MQRNIEILSSSSSTKAKIKALNELTQFKKDIEDFANSDDGDNYDFDINVDNVNASLHELYQKLTNFEINNASDLQELLIIRKRITKCSDIIENIKPKIIMVSVDNDDMNITDKIKKKFTLASVNKPLLNIMNWDFLDSLYENDLLKNMLDPSIKSKIPSSGYDVKLLHKSCFDIYTSIEIDDGTQYIFNNNGKDSICKCLIDDDDYFIYLFYQYGQQFFCVYYEGNDIIIEHPKCRCSIENSEGIVVTNVGKTMINDIINIIEELFE